MFSSNNPNKQTVLFNQETLEVYPLQNNPEYSILISHSIKSIKELWAEVAPKNNLFLQSTYLQLLEEFPPEKMGFRYIVFFKNQQPIGLSYNQTFHLKIEDSLQQTAEGEEAQSNCIISAISRAIKKWFIKRADFNLLICGNMFQPRTSSITYKLRLRRVKSIMAPMAPTTENLIKRLKLSRKILLLLPARQVSMN